MAFHPISVRRCSGVVLAAAMATMFAACSGPAPGTGEGIARGTAEGGKDASAQPVTAPDGAAPAATTAAATAPDPGASAAAVVSDAPDSPTVGGDGSEIVLAPLSAVDIDGAGLAGELACSFSIGDAPPLLLAMGDVASQEPSRGVVKVGDSVEGVAAPGGFDAMLRGAQFAGTGKTIRIALTGPATGTGESPQAPATLIYDRADGARRSYTGQWQCGP